MFAYLCVYVCLPPMLLITSDVIWTSYDWLSKSYSLYVAIVVGIVSRCGLYIDTHHENQPNKHKLPLFKWSIPFNSSLKWLYINSKMECFSYKGGYTCGVMHIKALKRRACFDYL